MSSTKKGTTLAEQINSLISRQPSKFGSDDDSGDDTRAQVVEHEECEDSDGDFRTSSIRKRNVDLLDQVDERYKGKKVSRKDIYNDDEESENSDDSNEVSENANESEMDDESDMDEESENNENSENDASDMEEEEKDNDKSDDEESEEFDSNSESESLDDIGNPRSRQMEDKKIKTISSSNVGAEIEKSNCVREQINIWENFLEMRIKFQKCLIVSNQLPQHNVYQNYNTNDEFAKQTNDIKHNLSKLLNNFIQLRRKLITSFPETKDIYKKGKKRKADGSESNLENEEDPMDEEIPSDFEGDEDDEVPDGSGNEESDEEDSSKPPPTKILKLSEYEEKLAENHKLYTPYRNTVIQKWNDRTRVASGNLCNKKNVNQPILKQIEYAIGNKDKLLRKTQLKRSEYNIIGKEIESTDDNDGRRVQEYDHEIYDDDDFYHELLRELIHFRTADITDPIQLSKQWIELQNMRKKIKRKIDTRATKGRRLRYSEHPKLVNLRAPIPAHETSTDLQKDELYSSFFGKIKPINNEQKE